jgi:hypothetical protein
MKRKHFCGIMLLLLAFTMTGCKDSVPECDPIVIVTNTDYTSDPTTVPYNEIHDVFAQYYSGADLSIALRDEIIERMEEKADLIGEDPTTLYQCIRATYADWNERPSRIPCYAEKCMYENQVIWAIAFNRANSFDETSLEHFDLYFVSCTTNDTLYHTGCF